MQPVRTAWERIGCVVLPPFVALFLLSSACESREPEVFSTALPGDVFEQPPASAPSAGASAAHALQQIGIAPTPRHFPRHSPDDIRDMMNRSAQLGTVAILIYQWGDPQYKQVATRLVKLAREHRMTPVVGLSPTTLDQQRKELDVPANIRGSLGRPSFVDAAVRSAFVRAGQELAQLKVPYLCLATEINFLALQRMDEFLRFVAVYKETYRAVKRVAPETKVFVSFQYEFVRILDNKEPGKVSDHAKVIDIFRPELDVLAITSYPAEYYTDPDAMPVNYYSHLSRYTKQGDEAMVMEIGWPSSGVGTLAEQHRFVERLPNLLSGLAPSIIAWSLLHDVRISQFGNNLASTGLLTVDGQAKPAMEPFRQLARYAAQTRTSP